MAELQTVRGMRDYEPEKARKWLYIRNVCVSAFEKYGFAPLQTPMVEYFEVLAKKGAGGEAIRDEIYYFKDKGGREIGLRFDLTVPLARFVAKNKDLPKPFKRYSIDRAYRYDRPGENRYREFMQADVDIVGSASVFADFEIVAIAVEVMKRLGLKFSIRVNNKKLLEGAAASCNVSDAKVKACFRCLDKLDKVGVDGVKKELKQNDISSDILELLQKGSLKSIEKRLRENEGCKELNELFCLLKEQGLDKNVKVDLCLARGLDYYTGNLFEIVAEGSGVSIGGGGRYDNLIGVFGGQKAPAIGISFGIDRLVDLLEDKIKVEASLRVLVAGVGKEMQGKALDLVQKIRGLGINAVMDLNARGISKNLDYANKLKIPFVAILGEKEIKAKEFTLKEMKTGKESKVKLADLKKLVKLVE